MKVLSVIFIGFIILGILFAISPVLGGLIIAILLLWGIVVILKSL